MHTASGKIMSSFDSPILVHHFLDDHMIHMDQSDVFISPSNSMYYCHSKYVVQINLCQILSQRITSHVTVK